MIVPMKKAGIIVEAKDARKTVDQLASLGVVHVEASRAPVGKDIDARKQDLELLEGALRALDEDVFVKGEQVSACKEPKDWKTGALHIVDLAKRYERCKEFSRNFSAKISQWEPWGDFDLERLEDFRKKGIIVRLYEVPAAEVKKFPKGAVLEVLKVERGMAYCALVSDKPLEVPFKEIELPKMSLRAMKARQEEDTLLMEQLVHDVRACMGFKETFLRQKQAIGKDLEFLNAWLGMGERGSLSYLTGYVPFDKTQDLISDGRKASWAVFITDPAPEDRVPTLIRNPRWISVIAPLFKVIEVVPGYQEADMSLWVLIFLSIFFGMLIGDAGYGVVFLALTFWMQRKLGRKAKNKSPFILSYIFSGCAVLWGILSGTYFGQAWLPPGIGPLVPALRDNTALQSFCFFLGALHLTIAHLWRAALKWPSLSALADVGWSSILWGAFFLARTLITGMEFPGFAKWFFIAGPFLVVLFSSGEPWKLKSLGSGAGNLLLNFVNSFTDVVSYIRLFAVGLATVAVADAFNSMAMGVGFSSMISGAVSVLILLLGHLLNIVLGPMAVLVHGVRLNVLEFSGQADIKWSGFAYRPLARGEEPDFHPAAEKRAA
ncbi:MAG: hypothetical protein WC732_09400 [Candidatus Omnitrophota bacterium]